MMNKAIGDVINERKAQVTREGHLATYDDTINRNGELAAAAGAYAFSACLAGSGVPANLRDGVVMRHWPWSAESFKPKSQREDLVRAAALLIAEIERLDRKNNC